MEQCTRKVLTRLEERSIYLMSIFDWKVVDRKPNQKGETILTFQRDTSAIDYKEIVEVEKSIQPKLIPLWSLFCFVGIAFALVTTYLILFLANRDSFDPVKNFYFFFIPSFVFLFLAVVIFYLRSKQMTNYLNKEEELVKKAEENVLKIKEKYKINNQSY